MTNAVIGYHLFLFDLSKFYFLLKFYFISSFYMNKKYQIGFINFLLLKCRNAAEHVRPILREHHNKIAKGLFCCLLFSFNPKNPKRILNKKIGNERKKIGRKLKVARRTATEQISKERRTRLIGDSSSEISRYFSLSLFFSFLFFSFLFYMPLILFFREEFLQKKLERYFFFSFLFVPNDCIENTFLSSEQSKQQNKRNIFG